MGKNWFLIGLIIVVVIAILGILVIYIATNKNVPSPKTETKTPAPGKETASQKPAEQETGETAEAVTPTEQAETGGDEFEFRFTGCILMPKFKSAFILNTLTNNEQLYQEGGFLHSLKNGRWTIFQITSTEVILQQYYPDGSVSKERIMKLAEKVTPEKPGTKATTEDILHSFAIGAKKPETPKTKESIDLTKPEDLDQAMKETSFSDIMKQLHTLPETLIQSFLNNLPEEYLRHKLEESSLGPAISEDTYKNAKPAEIINTLRKVADDFNSSGDRILAFSTQVNNSDYSPITPTNAFTPDTKKIYTCFRNEGALAKLDTVIIKWTNVSRQNILNWGAFKINPASPYNFIYLSMDKGATWEPGHYMVTLYKQIQDANPTACGEFDVNQ